MTSINSRPLNAVLPEQQCFSCPFEQASNLAYIITRLKEI